ncbi:MAG: hypothetical protein HZB33_16220 [Nitrospirae bacterium]|nr:hypothetical protein [Nitrospirota bacterium]
MKKQIVLIGAFIVVLAIVVSGSISFSQDKEKVSIAKKEGIGSYLIQSNGKALYYFKNDSPNNSTCVGACAEKWPSYCYKLDEIEAGEGLNISDFGVFVRPGSERLHLTYKGMPIYEYEGDKGPGDVTGHGVNNLWFAIQP